MVPNTFASGGYAIGIKTVAASGTPERMHDTQGAVKCKKVTLWGRKAARTDNAGIVYVGPDSANDSENNVIKIAAGGEFVITAVDGQYIDLYDLYIDVVTNADGVTYLAQGLL